MRRSLQNFITKPLPAETLGLFRIFASTFALTQVIVLLPDWMLLFGPEGLLPWQVSDALNTKSTPTLSIFSNVPGVYKVYIVTSIYIISLLALILGFYTRAASIIAWLSHLILNSTGHMTAYGVETFTHISLFYCMVLPAGIALSIDKKRGKYANVPPHLVTLSIRIVQLHLAIMYCASGIEKALGEQWWSGEAIWMALQQDQFRQFDMGWLANVPLLTTLLGWGTVALEMLFPVAMFVSQTKKIWLPAIVGMHLFIIVFLGLHLFGILMILLNLAAFGQHCYPQSFRKLYSNSTH